MKKLSSYLKPYTVQCILAPLFKLFEVLLELYVPLIIASIADSGIPSMSNEFIVKKCLLLILCPLLGFLCAGTAQYFAANASAEFASDVRESLFSKIESLSYTQLDTLGTSTLLNRMTSDANALQQGVNMGLRLLLRSPFVVFGAMIMAFTIDVKSALIFAVAIPVLLVVSFAIILSGMPLVRKAQKQLDNVTVRTRDNLNGVRIVRAMGIEEREKKDFADSTLTLMQAQNASAFLSSVLNPITVSIVNVCIAFLVWKGAVRVQLGVLTQGQVLSLYNYMSQILVELVKLANLVITLSKANAAGERISAVLEMPDEGCGGTGINSESGNIALSFENVSFSYSTSEEPALSDISFSLQKGETLGIIGGTGCGKTTLINLIPGFYSPSKGTVKEFGTDTQDADISRLRKAVSIVQQKAVLFSGTVRSNLLMGDENASDEDIWSSLSLSMADEFVKEKGLDCPVEQKGKNFSGGQKQRLSIARALISKPQILILDDSFSALDAATDSALRNNLKRLSWNPTIIIVSQRIASVKDADKILVMEDGRICGEGTHEELIRSCSQYREIVSSQTGEEVKA